MEIRSLIKTKIPSIECHWHEARKEHHMARLFSTVRLKMGQNQPQKFKIIEMDDTPAQNSNAKR